MVSRNVYDGLLLSKSVYDENVESQYAIFIRKKLRNTLYVGAAVVFFDLLKLGKQSPSVFPKRQPCKSALPSVLSKRGPFYPPRIAAASALRIPPPFHCLRRYFQARFPPQPLHSLAVDLRKRPVNHRIDSDVGVCGSYSVRNGAPVGGSQRYDVTGGVVGDSYEYVA